MKVRSLAFSLVMAAAIPGPATAAVYTGIWDPPFGGSLAADLGWRGEADFFVPSSCEPASTTAISNSQTCGGAAVVIRAVVELYDTNGPVDLVATLTFVPASIVISTLHYLAGNLDQLDTGVSSLIAPVVESGVDLATYGLSPSTPFGLQFTASGPRLFYRDCQDCVLIGNDATAHPPSFTVSRVPEPASIVLSGLAIGALATVRRRRCQAAMS